MFAALIMLGAIVALGAPTSLVLIPWTLITGDPTILYNLSLYIVRFSFRLVGIHVRTTGLERIPAGVPCIFLSNHVSNLDPPSLITHIPGRTSVFLKRSLTKIPILGYALKLGDFIPVDRDGRIESAIENARAAKRVLDKGIHIVTFVEGTRSRDGRMLPFKKGPFYLAMEATAPCIPVSIYGTEKLMAKGSLRIQPGFVYITFHAPIHSRDYATREELMEAVRVAIASGLPEWMRG